MTRPVVHAGLLLLAAVLVAMLARLGFWQLARATEKQSQQDSHQQRTAAPPLSSRQLQQADATPDELRFRRAEIAGHYDTGHQLLLDNRTQDGVAGYHVYTPLALDEDSPLLLVNRGWVATGLQRTQLPPVGVGSEQRLVRGTLEVPRADLFLLGDAGYEAHGWPRVVQKLDPALVAGVIGRAVAPVVLLLDADDGDGFSRRWTAYLGISPDRHRGYAVQWFALAATLLLIAVSLSWRSLRARRQRT